VTQDGLDSPALRQLIREVLAEALPAVTSRQPGTGNGCRDASHAGTTAAGHFAGVAVPRPGGPEPAAAVPPPAVPPPTVPPPTVPPPAVPPGRVPPGQPGASLTVHDSAQRVETVSLRTDADLTAFVTRLLHLFENPARRLELRSGRLRFRLAGPGGPGQAGPSRRVEKGAVTEAMVRDAARAGARLVLGPRAVLTPLARDRARAAGVEIERERS
jgi:hypothetical protein